MRYFERYNSRGVYTIYETEDWDPFGDDRLRLWWDHPAFPGQWSLRFSSFPIPPDDEPAAPCLDCAEDSWVRDALARHFGFDGCLAACLPAGELFRMAPSRLSGGGVRDRARPGGRGRRKRGGSRVPRYNGS